MCLRLLVVIMVTGLLGFFADANATGKGGLLKQASVAKPTGLHMKAPSDNPIDKAAEDAYNGEMSGKLTHEEARDLYTNAYMDATPEQRQQHLDNEFSEDKPSLMRSPGGE